MQVALWLELTHTHAHIYRHRHAHTHTYTLTHNHSDLKKQSNMLVNLLHMTVFKCISSPKQIIYKINHEFTFMSIIVTIILYNLSVVFSSPELLMKPGLQNKSIIFKSKLK